MKRGRTTRLRYKEGDFFAVRLRDGRFATGLAARVARGGRVVLGYFFGPPKPEPASLEDVKQHRPADAVLVARFGDLSLQDGDWRIIGQVEWNRQEWKVPEFGRISGGLAWRVVYAEDDPLEVLHEVPCSIEEAAAHPSDNLLGAGAVEIKLTKLLEF